MSTGIPRELLVEAEEVGGEVREVEGTLRRNLREG